MRRRSVLLAVPALWLSSALGAPSLPTITVSKDAGCGCCEAWMRHLESAGFTVVARNVPDLVAEKRRAGIPEPLASCHTARVGDYLIEGHVPAADIKRLLAMRPDALGLAVPGMPAGSPGMEVAGRSDPYEVLLFDRAGRVSVFARYPKG